MGKSIDILPVAAERGGSSRAAPSVSASPPMDLLQADVAASLLPRLLISGKSDRDAAREFLGGARLTASDYTSFYNIAVYGSNADCADFTTALIERGVEKSVILLELLTETARRLGRDWEDDEVSFTDVTIALCRIHHVLRREEWNNGQSCTLRHDAPHIALTTVGDDQHILGILIVGEIFREAGWRVSVCVGVPKDEIAELLSREFFDALAISASVGSALEAADGEISLLRSASRNNHIKVIAGGVAFENDPDLGRQIGADVVALTAAEAKKFAISLQNRAQVGS